MTSVSFSAAVALRPSQLFLTVLTETVPVLFLRNTFWEM